MVLSFISKCIDLTCVYIFHFNEWYLTLSISVFILRVVHKNPG